jgi:hypothetical protein
VLDAQLEDFTGGDRWKEMVLGLVGATDRVAALATLPRGDGGAAAAGPLADFFLGVISVGLTLRTILGCQQPAAAEAAEAAGASAAPTPRAGMLR